MQVVVWKKKVKKECSSINMQMSDGVSGEWDGQGQDGKPGFARGSLLWIQSITQTPFLVINWNVKYFVLVLKFAISIHLTVLQHIQMWVTGVCRFTFSLFWNILLMCASNLWIYEYMVMPFGLLNAPVNVSAPVDVSISELHPGRFPSEAPMSRMLRMSPVTYNLT